MTSADCLRLTQFIASSQQERTAIECGDRTVTYAELMAQVDARAGELSRWVYDGAVVALRRDKSVAYVTDLLAILALGGIVMPIDTRLPDARVEAMMRIVPPQAVITDHDLRATDWHNPVSDHPHRGERPAYVMFTSGSTGTPKAILGNLSALLHFIEWQGCEFDVSEEDRVSFLTPVGFDVSLRDIFLPLLHGATLVIPVEQDISTPGSLTRWMASKRISIVHGVPSVAKLWARAMGHAAPTLRIFFLAGEKLYPATVAELRAAFGDRTEYVNLYGPSETTLAKFFHRVEKFDADDIAPIPVGRPLPGTSFGFRGVGSGREVVITTRNATLGYINPASADAARFVNNGDETVSYHTGDLGKLSESGDLVIVGRADEEVKINGVRVHPNEVTQALQGYAAAQDILVFTTTLGGMEPRLAAVWIAKPGWGSLPDSAPREHAMDHLPQAIVPTIWRKLDEFPKNANGKVDRARLAAIVSQGASAADRPRTETEAWLCRQVSEILECSAPSPTDDLFGLGATSIHVAFLIGKIEDALGKSLDFADVFTATKLCEIADLIDRSPARETVAIPKLAEAKTYVLSPQQRRWWNIYMPKGNRSWATMVRVMQFDVAVDAAQVKKGLLDLAVQQDSMRLSFLRRDDGVLQQETPVTDETKLDIAVRDFSDQIVETSSGLLDALRLEVANSEIATDTWPLFRASVALLPGGRSALVFAMHHMISDGFSMNLIETQLRRFLERDVPIPAPARFNYLSYADWAAKAEPRLAGPGSEAQRYWADVFKTPYRKHVFAEKWAGAGHDRGQGYCVKVPDPVRDSVKVYARSHRVTEFSLYLTAKFRALHRILKCSDLVIGTPAAGRELKGAEDLVGNFISLVCVRSRRDGDQTALDHVRQTMQGVACAMTHQNYQYDTLVSDLGMQFEQSRFPLTTIFISYLNFSGAGRGKFDPRDQGFSDLGFAVKFDKMSYVREHDDATSLLVQYRNNLFDRAEIEHFVTTWIDELDAIVRSEAPTYSNDNDMARETVPK
jgi:amino acid adenylation domain-containing protein